MSEGRWDGARPLWLASCGASIGLNLVVCGLLCRLPLGSLAVFSGELLVTLLLLLEALLVRRRPAPGLEHPLWDAALWLCFSLGLVLTLLALLVLRMGGHLAHGALIGARPISAELRVRQLGCPRGSKLPGAGCSWRRCWCDPGLACPSRGRTRL